MREIIFVFEKIILYFECALKKKKRRKKKKKMNIHVEYLRFNIVFFHNIDDFFNETKTRIIDENAKSTSNVLLIINTSLIINDSKYKFKNKLISTIRRKDEKMIYINNKFFSRAFFKFVIDYIFEMNCDY